MALTVHLGIPGATVRLTRQRVGDPAPVSLATLVTGSGGTARYGVRPPVATTYRVEYQGDGQQWLPATAEVVVSVRPRVTLVADARVYRGDRTRLAVSVRPAHPGGSVTLQLWQDGAWADWRTLKLDAGSRGHSTWRADAVGTYPLRAVAAADAEHAEGRSPACRTLVIKPNPYHVPIEAKAMIVVDISQYRMHFFSRGLEVRSFPCVTGRPSLPTPIGHFKVYARGMYPGGPVRRTDHVLPPAVRHPRHQRAVAAQQVPAQLLARLHAALQLGRDLALRPRAARHAGLERALSRPGGRPA